MEIEGIIQKIYPAQQGTSANGNNWQKRIIVISTLDQYPKDVAITVLRDTLMPLTERLSVGQQVVFSVNIKSREYNGKWYTDVETWKFDAQPLQQVVQHHPAPQPQYQQPQQPQRQQFQQAAQQFAAQVFDTGSNDDLPF